MPTIVVITPTYNEKENIKKLIEEVMNLSDVNLIVIDDASPDNTGKYIEELKNIYKERLICIHRQKKLGFASACVEGFRYVLTQLNNIDYIITMDSDLSHPPAYLPNIIEKLNSYDVVVGSRYINGKISVVNWPLKRLILSRLGNLYAKFITGLPINDCTSGFVGYRKKVIEDIINEKKFAEGYSFLIELKYKVYTKKYSIKETPIIFIERNKGVSKMSKKIMIEALFIVFLLRIRNFFKKFKKLKMSEKR